MAEDRRARFEEDLLHWILRVQAESKLKDRALVIGLNGPQGAGKSTIAGKLVGALEAFGLRAATVSIDDFYLTRDGQEQLGARHPGNRFLRHRGYPGTHDVALGEGVILSLRDTRAESEVTVPSYDKSAFDGLGDRHPQENWRTIRAPLAVVIVEGWMLGFRPVPEETIDDPALRSVNGLLADYDRWTRLLDGLIQLTMADESFVVDWRIEAEATMRRQGRPGMSPAAIRQYVESFLPAYRLYPGVMAARSPVTGPHLVVTLGRDRLPLHPVAQPKEQR